MSAFSFNASYPFFLLYLIIKPERMEVMKAQSAVTELAMLIGKLKDSNLQLE